MGATVPTSALVSVSPGLGIVAGRTAEGDPFAPPLKAHQVYPLHRRAPASKCVIPSVAAESVARRLSGPPGRNRLCLLCAMTVMAASMAPPAARADEYKIYSPLVVKGENEFEFRGYDVRDSSPQVNGDQQYRASFERGITNNWVTEVYAVMAKPPGGNLRSHNIELENRFQLTPMGKYWATFGLYQALEIPTQSGIPYELEIMPLIQKQSGRRLAIANLDFERNFGTNREHGTIFSYRLLLEYKLYQAFSPAVEFHGEPGPIGAFHPLAAQDHEIGPAVYGVSYFANYQTVHYSAALLFGVTRGSPDLRIVFRFGYEFFDLN